MGNQCRFQVGDRVFFPLYGCGTVLAAAPYLVNVAFDDGKTRPLAPVKELRLATPEDVLLDFKAARREPEPVNELATLEALQQTIEAWAQSVESIVGEDDSDEFGMEVFNRYWLHGLLRGLAQKGIAIPPELQNRIEVIDQRYLEVTVPLSHDICSDGKHYDQQAFWYYYRWPK